MDTALVTKQVKALRAAADITALISSVDEKNDYANRYFKRMSTQFRAAANLLEVHEATGISLEQFGEVGDFVNDMLKYVGMPPFEPNGV